jgi:hypothetical protein
MKGWVRGGSTLEFFHELFESGIDFINLDIELFLDVVNFGINEKHVSIQFLIGFVFASRRYLGIRGGSMEKKEDK